MELHSGIPYWVLKNGLQADYPKLTTHLPGCDVVIIGSGISGALSAHALCTAGFSCTIVDARLAASGSTWASTAHINYETDLMLHELADKYNPAFATAVFHACRNAVYSLQKVFTDTGVETDMVQRPALYLASNKKGLKTIEAEYSARKNAGIPIEFLNAAALEREYGIDRLGALRHNDAAQMDPYKGAAGLLAYHVKNSGLKIYTRTHIEKLNAGPAGVELITDDGLVINARHVICAAGYEAGKFLPEDITSLNSTYALITPPVDPALLWADKALIWETARPYFYLRTTLDNRVVLGGQDIIFKNAKVRDAKMPNKTKKLLEESRRLFPNIPVEAEFDWCGTFSETADTLPYIGKHPDLANVYFALGYGGNGTMFSQLAAEIICNTLQGIPDERAVLFGFER